MTKEVYQKARQLNDDIYMLNSCLREVKEQHHWITMCTPNKKEVGISCKLQDELVAWVEQKQKEYQKEFDELGCE